MTIHQFKKQFPHEDACLEYIFAFRFPELKHWYRVKGRKCWTNPEGTKQVYPLKGTIFEKSTTNLVSWFHAIYLFSVSKNGVSAMELQRQIGVTYKCAWRMCHQIRLLMGPSGEQLSGIVEVDEAFMGPVKKKQMVVGMVERGGRLRAQVVSREKHHLINTFDENVAVGSTVMSDMSPYYSNLRNKGFKHWSVNHGRQYVSGKTHINTLEGFWAQLKRSINGTTTLFPRRICRRTWTSLLGGTRTGTTRCSSCWFRWFSLDGLMQEGFEIHYYSISLGYSCGVMILKISLCFSWMFSSISMTM